MEEDQAFFSEQEEDSHDPKSILIPVEVDQAFFSEREEIVMTCRKWMKAATLVSQAIQMMRYFIPLHLRSDVSN